MKFCIILFNEKEVLSPEIRACHKDGYPGVLMASVNWQKNEVAAFRIPGENHDLRNSFTVHFPIFILLIRYLNVFPILVNVKVILSGSLSERDLNLSGRDFFCVNAAGISYLKIFQLR